MAKRKSLSKRTRFEVFKRDQFTCQYCGGTPPRVVLVVDHIIPVAGGGENDASNLLTSCFDCNAGKSDVPLTSVPRPLSDQVEERKERSEQVSAFNAYLMEERRNNEAILNEIGRHWFDCFEKVKGQFVFSNVREMSIKTFLKHLAPAEILDAIDIAMAKFPPRFNQEHKNAWKYFCGVCWGVIRAKQD